MSPHGPYIRLDAHEAALAAERDAAVAAALREAAKAIDGANGHNEAADRRCKDAILALIPDAGAALDRVLAEARAELRSEIELGDKLLDEEARAHRATLDSLTAASAELLATHARAEALEAQVKRLEEVKVFIVRWEHSTRKDEDCPDDPEWTERTFLADETAFQQALAAMKGDGWIVTDIAERALTPDTALTADKQGDRGRARKPRSL